MKHLDTHRTKSQRSPLAAYACTFLPFIAAMWSTAMLLDHSLLAYALLVSALIAGFVFAGLLIASTLNASSNKALSNFLNRVPGINQVFDNIHLLQETVELLEARYQTLTDNLAAAILFRDLDGNILYCSPYIEVLTGYSRDEIYENSQEFFSKIVHDEDKEKVERSLGVSQLGEAFQFRYRFYHNSGLLMWAETRTAPLLDEHGQLQALLSITFDVTGSMRYQQRVEEHNNDLKDFSYMLSHDLKSPMVTIRGMLTALKEDYESSLDDDALALISHAERASDRLQSLVGGVIEYSRIANLEERQQPIDCGSLVDEVTQELQVQVSDAKATFSAGVLPVVWGDRTMLYQVFLNLLSNALKYRNPDKNLEVKVEAELVHEDRSCLIRVSDNGRGIPADRLDNIFRPFHRAHGSEIEGSGIGLASVKKLVERMGGCITVESDEDYGSTFILQLRVADPSAAPFSMM